MTTHAKQGYANHRWFHSQHPRYAPWSLFIATGWQRAGIAAVLTLGIWSLVMSVLTP